VLRSALRFTALTELAFSLKLEAELQPFLIHFEQHVRNQKYYTPMKGGGGGNSTWYLQELEKEMQQHGSEN